MKIIRSIVVCFFGIVFFLNCILLYVSGTTQGLFSPNVSNLIIENISIAKPLEDVLQNMIGDVAGKENIVKQIQQVEETIKNSKEFKRFVHTFTVDVIDSIANLQAPIIDIDKDIEKIIDTYKDVLKMGLGKGLPDTQKEALIQELKEKLNVKEAYEDIVAYARRYLAPQHKLIQIVNFLSKPYASILLFGAMIIHFILLFVFTRSLYRSVLIVSGALVLAGISLFIGSSLVIQWLTNVPLVVKEILSIERQRMITYAVWYVVIGIGLVLVYRLRIVFVNYQKKQHIE